MTDGDARPKMTIQEARRIVRLLKRRRLRQGVRMWPASAGTLYLGRNKAKREKREKRGAATGR